MGAVGPGRWDSQPTEAHQTMKEESVGWRGGGRCRFCQRGITHTYTERSTLAHSTQLAGMEHARLCATKQR